MPANEQAPNPWGWYWGESAPITHAQGCLHPLDLYRSRENGPIDRAVCPNCGHTWARNDSDWKWRPEPGAETKDAP